MSLFAWWRRTRAAMRRVADEQERGNLTGRHPRASAREALRQVDEEQKARDRT